MTDEPFIGERYQVAYDSEPYYQGRTTRRYRIIDMSLGHGGVAVIDVNITDDRGFERFGREACLNLANTLAREMEAQYLKLADSA